MIRALRIENFRCYRELSLSDLGLVNVVVGDNSSGKTSLLEAIFLGSAGFPEVLFRMRRWRGLEAGLSVINRTRAFYDSLWEDIFPAFDTDKTIQIELIGQAENARTLRVRYDPNDSAASSAGEMSASGAEIDSTAIRPITFESTAPNGQTETFKPKLTSEGIEFGGMNWGAPVTFFSSASAQVIGPSEPADRFSALSTKGQAGPIRSAMKVLFPDIKQISVESHRGKPTLFCLAPGSRRQKLPIALVSAGINKVVSILLGIASTPKGVVLIDEIENGLYFNTMPKVWEAIYTFSRRYGVQVFATSHSKECLSAVLPTLRRHESKFRLLRAERRGDKRVVRLFPGVEFESALEQDFEIR